jgi:sugar fermentation stimulation protein A
VAAGDRAVLLFLANRPFGDRVRACHERDPAYARALAWAQRQGVEILCYRTAIEPPAVTLTDRVPVVLVKVPRAGAGTSTQRTQRKREAGS